MEYVVCTTSEAVEHKRYLDISLVSPAFVSISFATRFKSRERAATLAKRFGGTVELFCGVPDPRGSKHYVAPKQSPINRRAAYRSI